jgi:hypothetical protein
VKSVFPADESGSGDIGSRESSSTLSRPGDPLGSVRSPTNPGLLYLPEGHRYLDSGDEVVSLSRLLEIAGFATDFSKVDPSVLARKTLIGKAVHRAIWLFLHDDLEWDSLGEDIYGYVRAAARRIELVDSTPRWSELPIGGSDLGYACTPDLVWADGSVEEWKCTYRIYPKVRIQLAGQAVAVNPAAPGGRRVTLLKPDGSYKTEEYEDENDFEVFHAARAIAAWRMRYDR